MYKNDTVQFLINLQRFGWRLGLHNITGLLEEMGNPHLRFKSIHLGGTNGKGSTAAMLESIFRQSGYKTGLYTSPHLLDETERIKVKGSSITWENLKFYLNQVRDKIQRLECTYFEALTAVAFQHFADSCVDVAFIEVGLGGRFDATNVIRPQLTIITEIDLDHMEYLGTTKKSIAIEKAGIIKIKIPCLSGATNQKVKAILAHISKERNAKFYDLKDFCTLHPKNLTEEFSEFKLIFSDKQYYHLKLGLVGRHQIKNAALAVAAVQILNQQNFNIKKEDIYKGFEKICWPGRLQKLQNNPKIVLDVAHNPAGMRKLVSALKSIYHYDRLIFIIGILKDKNYKVMTKIITSVADYIFIVTPSTERSLPGDQLAKEIVKFSDKFQICPNTMHAFQTAVSFSNQKDLICVTGSHYTVGEFLKCYKNS
ncbi:MAG: bifunctional folylpolyglutamate synthase/dihydrofolate synthase [bacterium]